jgi:AbiV family abortive infection protein
VDKNTERTDAAESPAYVKQRQHCLDHAADLIRSAERLLEADSTYPHISYHLSILSMEEIGKAGMLSARAVTDDALDARRFDKRLDSHIQKLMWAVWSPSMSSGKIDPKDFEEARRFAESTHNRRMAGLYVDHSQDGADAPPRQAVRLDQATSLLNLAKARLALEVARGAAIPDEKSEDLQWFLATASEDLGRKRLFGPSFMQKHGEFGGDTRAWVRWARDEFLRIEAEEKAHLQRELVRQASEPGQGKPKWLMKVRVQTPSHSLRQKTLNYWNDRIEAVKLRAVGDKNSDLMLEITINDHVTVEQVFDFGLSFSKLHIAMLNIGTCGFFWYELSAQGQTYYESIQDLEAPQMNLTVSRASGLSKEWIEDLPDGKKRQRVALEDVHLNLAIMCLAVFASMPEKDAAPIFGEYLRGLTLLSKTDLHLSIGGQARDAFLAALRAAMRHFGDLESGNADLLPALHRALEPVIAEKEHRNQVFRSLDGTVSDGSVADAVSAKRAADLYLSLTARNQWPKFTVRAKQREEQR